MYFNRDDRKQHSPCKQCYPSCKQAVSGRMRKTVAGSPMNQTHTQIKLAMNGTLSPTNSTEDDIQALLLLRSIVGRITLRDEMLPQTNVQCLSPRNLAKLIHEYCDRVYIRKDVILKLSDYGNLNQSKLMTY